MQSQIEQYLSKLASNKISQYFNNKLKLVNTPITQVRKRPRRRIVLPSRRIRKISNMSIIDPAPIVYCKAYGSLKFVYDTTTSTDTIKFTMYNGSAGTELSTSVNVFDYTTGMPFYFAMHQTHIAKLQTIYDKYRILGVQVNFHQAGTVTQDDSSNTTINSPLAICLNQSGVAGSMGAVLAVKPSIILSLRDKTLSYSLPQPIPYSDVENAMSDFNSVNLCIAPMQNTISSLEYLWDISYKVQFKKQEVKLEGISSIV